MSYYDSDPQTPDVPYMVHEGTCVRLERINKRLWILCIIMFLALVVSNAGWIWYESSFLDVSEETVETSTDGGGNAYGTLISGDGSSVTYGNGDNN